LINASVTPINAGVVEQTASQGGANLIHIAEPSFDSADFAEPPGNLCAVYVLPPIDLAIFDAGIILTNECLFTISKIPPPFLSDLMKRHA